MFSFTLWATSYFCGLYFTVKWFCLVFPTVPNRKASFFGYLFGLTCQWPHTICKSLWPIFHDPVIFSFISSSYLIDKHHTLTTCSVSHCESPQIYLRSLWHIFHGWVILPFISDCIKLICTILWILVQSDTVNDPILFVGDCDLYFMSLWFYLVSLTLSYKKTSYLRYLFSLTLGMTSYILWPLWPIFHGLTYISVYFLNVRGKLP